MGANFSSLNRKFFCIILAGTTILFGILTLAILQREKEIIFNIHKQQALITASLIADDISALMDNDHADALADTLREHADTAKVQIGVARLDGSPAFNADLSVPKEYLDSTEERFIAQGDHYTVYKPIRNETTCHRCHRPGDRVRGIITIRGSLRQATAEITATARRLLAYGGVMGLASGVLLVIFLRRYVTQPIAQLTRGALLLREGHLDARVSLDRRDEMGVLAASFNDMADSIRQARDHLGDAVRQRTTELRVIAELSLEVFKGNLSADALIEQFLSSITGSLGFGYASLCLIDKETGLLSQEFSKGIEHGFCSMEIAMASDHVLTRTIREARSVIRSSKDIGMPDAFANVAIIPLLSHQRRHCREVNLCTFEDCPAYANEDDRCWLIGGTLCRSPQAVAGKEKIYGCLHCDVFPVLGVLIAGRKDEIPESSLHSLEILGSEIASAIENQRLIDAKKSDIAKLIRLHDISVESLQNPGKTLSTSIVSSVTAFSNVDAAILLLAEGDGTLHLAEASGIDTAGLPSPISSADSFVGRAIREDRPVETLRMADLSCFEEAITREKFLYAASVPLRFKETVFGCLTLFRRRDFLMTDSEKAIVLLFASQASAALNTSRLFSSVKAEQEFSDAIFNCAASGIMVLDREGRILKINGIGAEILHIDAVVATGWKITDLFPELEDVFLFGMGIGREVNISCPDGKTIPIGFSNSPLFDAPDGKLGVIVLFRDLTEIKKLQDELRRKEHFEAMGMVLSGVAHEIRNPLFGISSIGQILDREIDIPQYKSLIQAMLKETERMKRLLEELLLYTRPARLDIREVDLVGLFNDMRHFISAKRGDVTLHMKMPPHLSVAADKDKITQVFLNLLNNAIDAARYAITLSASKQEKEVRIVITDDGPGIPAENLQRIFDPFFTTKKGGTGLGLPISRKIIEDHGGSIDIRSKAGGGTTVTVTCAAPEA